MQGLSKLLNLDKSSITGLVDRAEHRGLVRRIPAIDDRRTIRVSLTPSGRRVVGAVAASFAADVRSATASLSDEEQRQLSILATRVVYDHWASTSQEEPRENVGEPDYLRTTLAVPFPVEDPPRAESATVSADKDSAPRPTMIATAAKAAFVPQGRLKETVSRRTPVADVTLNVQEKRPLLILRSMLSPLAFKRTVRLLDCPARRV